QLGWLLHRGPPSLFNLGDLHIHRPEVALEVDNRGTSLCLRHYHICRNFFLKNGCMSVLSTSMIGTMKNSFLREYSIAPCTSCHSWRQLDLPCLLTVSTRCGLHGRFQTGDYV